MSINKKFVVLVGIPLVAIILLTAWGMWTFRSVNQGLRTVVSDQFMGLINEEITPLIADQMLPLINEDLVRLQQLDRSLALMLEADRDMHQAIIAERALLTTTDEQTRSAANETNKENIGQAHARVGKASAHFFSPETQAMYANFSRAFETWRSATRQVVEQANDPDYGEAARASSNGGDAEKAFDVARGILDKLQEAQQGEINLVLARVDERKGLIEQQRTSMEQRKNAVLDVSAGIQEHTRSASTLFAVVGVVVGLLIPIVGLFTARSISKPIGRIITGLNDGADQVNDASGQVAQASQRLAEGAGEQASSLQETSSALEQMASMARTNADNAKEANALSNQARDAARSGDATMDRLNQAMTAINDSSGQISKIIKVIEEIAFQTNLLALNAAVEAARAGEHGKGFAVVADEVRNLAQRAAQAARETTGLIDESVARAREGTDVAQEVGEALSTIANDVNRVSDLVEGITKASAEQAQGVDQVNGAVSQMDQVTQQNASGAEESASAAEELSAQATAVKGIVDELMGVVTGRRQRSQRQPVETATPTTTNADWPPPPTAAPAYRGSQTAERSYADDSGDLSSF